jgi:hypothetical protein
MSVGVDTRLIPALFRHSHTSLIRAYPMPTLCIFVTLTGLVRYPQPLSLVVQLVVRHELYRLRANEVGELRGRVRADR